MTVHEMRVADRTLPRSNQCGPIEAMSLGVSLVDMFSLPRSTERGPIEAHEQIETNN